MLTTLSKVLSLRNEKLDTRINLMFFIYAVFFIAYIHTHITLCTLKCLQSLTERTSTAHKLVTATLILPQHDQRIASYANTLTAHADPQTPRNNELKS